MTGGGLHEGVHAGHVAPLPPADGRGEALERLEHVHRDRRAVLATAEADHPRDVSGLDEQGPEVDHATPFLSRVLMIVAQNSPRRFS